jgi:hypothetical protein
MSTDYERHRRELDEILQGLMTDKRMSQSDKRLIATNNRSEEWYKKTAERNRINANNTVIIEKIKAKNTGKRYTFLGEESKNKLAKAGWQPIHTPYGVFNSRLSAAEYFFKNNLSSCKVVPSILVWLSKKLKKEPDHYYYITREEYIKLTGDNPWQ